MNDIENLFDKFLLDRREKSDYEPLINHFLNKRLQKSNHRSLENDELFTEFVKNKGIFTTIIRIQREKEHKHISRSEFLKKYFGDDAPYDEKTLYNWIKFSKNYQNKFRKIKTPEVYIKYMPNIPASSKLFDEFLTYKTCFIDLKKYFCSSRRKDASELLQSFFKELEPRNLKIISKSISQCSAELPGKELTLHDIIFIDSISRIEVDLDFKSWTYLIDGLIKNFEDDYTSEDFNSTFLNKEKSLDTIYKFLNTLPECSVLTLFETISMVFDLKKYLKIELKPEQRNKLPKEVRTKRFLTSKVINQINNTLKTEVKLPVPTELLIILKEHLLTVIEIEENMENAEH
ncbi:hypothetical protein [Streptococcus sp. CF10-1]|jgi:hypothetical protein|uniref:hypothetical protein n=1 Tax=Streptococcus sp. CF10-1 TaxID=2963162 RepID=UPI0020C9314F|nr:hypothetical protein [Streptococcus sp. CF10-1]MCP9083459.1 hypothetical protein [Streptococcus sp. CF10-1]